MPSQEIVDFLIQQGKKFLEKPRELVCFSGDLEADLFLNNIEQYPHHFVLGCVMDRQVSSQRAWRIPWRFSELVGGYAFSKWFSVDLESVVEMFQRESFHHFNNQMSVFFYSAIQKIQMQYRGDSSLIWKDSPTSATLIRRFLEIPGFGPRLASMASSVLTRDFKVPLADRTHIDTSPEANVRRVFQRLGLVKSKSLKS